MGTIGKKHIISIQDMDHQSMDEISGYQLSLFPAENEQEVGGVRAQIFGALQHSIEMG